MRAFALFLFAFIAACADEGASNYQGQTNAATTAQPGWRLSPKGDLNAFFDCLADQEYTIISAHRGGPARGLPENALPTMLARLSQAPMMVEMDVATSSDGVLYLMHDDTIDRTTNGSGRADGLNWAEIKSLQLKDQNGSLTDFHPTKLSDALKALKDRTIIQIDFKKSTRYEDVIAEVKRQGAQDSVIYIAYSVGAASKLHRLDPQAMISLNIQSKQDLDEITRRGVPTNRLLGFTGIRNTNPSLYNMLEQNSIEIIFGTLGGRNSIDNQIARNKDTNRYSAFAKQGVDILATDKPLIAHKALQQQNRALKNGLCGVTYYE